MLAATTLPFITTETPTPRDRPLPARDAEGSVKVLFLGTSLTALYDWSEFLEYALSACTDRDIKVVRLAQPGATSEWGLQQIPAVEANFPDIVVIEFAINDADLRDGLALDASAQAHRTIVSALRIARPDIRIALMTMSPAQGLKGWIRPRLSSYYGFYHELAAELGIGLIDLYPRWMMRPKAERGLDVDGLHPDRAVARAMILPVLISYLADAIGITCGQMPT